MLFRSWNPVAEQDFGHATVISTVQRTVQSAQGEPKTPASIRRESRWRGSALHQQTMKAPRRVDSVLEQSVERKHERERARCRFTQEERASFRRQCQQVEIASLSRRGEERRTRQSKTRRFAQAGRHCREDRHPRVGLRVPYDRRLI